jgi:hypothetical protein
MGHDQNDLADRLEKPRTKWEQAFREMPGPDDDRLLDQKSQSQTLWDYEEWEW